MSTSDDTVLHLSEVLINQTDDGFHLTEIDDTGVVISGTYVPNHEWLAARRHLKDVYKLTICDRKRYIDLITALSLVMEPR